MKKITLCSLLIFCYCNVVMGVCDPVKSGGGKDYLKIDESGYLQCDKHQVGKDYECPYGTIVIESFGEEVKPDNIMDTFRCKQGTRDEWLGYTIPKCGDISPDEFEEAKQNNNLELNIKPIEIAGSKGWFKILEGEGLCWTLKCKNCANNKNKKKEGITPVIHKDPCEGYFKNPNLLACCKAKDADVSGSECKCKDGSKEWKFEDGKGQCIDKKIEKPDAPVVEPKPQQVCTVYTNIDVKCANGNYYKAVNMPVRVTGADICEFADRIVGVEFLIALQNAICGQEQYYQQYLIGNSNSSLLSSAQSAVSSLNGFFENEKVSVWKDKDGEFNKARLASDLTAGVVLGTVGGVVSGVVIKKKQVEKGFDALHCTVGGQTVADWGDEFRVGLKQ